MGAKDNLLRLVSAPVHSRTSEDGANCSYKPERQLFGYSPSLSDKLLLGNARRGGRISVNTQAATWTNQSSRPVFIYRLVGAHLVPHLL